jgi:transposase-like protein
MATSALSAPFFHDEAAAYAKLESLLWPHGPSCPRCGGLDRITPVKGGRIGLYRCGPCKRQFTVTVGTVFESSHVKLHLWFQATHLLCASKKGMSTHEIHRVLGVTYRTAWFMTMRLREAMRDGTLPMLGGEGETAEIDETYVGGKERNKHADKRIPKKGKGPTSGKEPVFSLVERGGRARSFHVAEVNGATLRGIVKAQLDGKTVVYSDDNHTTRYSVKGYKTEAVNHSIGEYVRGDAHTNTIESYFATLKRGIIGTYHHVSQQHLKRYLAEFDFRYNERSALGVEDAERAAKALKGIVGKRLTYKLPDNQQTEEKIPF